jgi:hypothetical protein
VAGELRFGCQYAERNFVTPRSSSSERPISKQEMASVKQRILMACAVLWFGCGSTMAQENGHIPVSMVEDWSTRHMIFAEDVARENRGAVLAEPRFWQQYLRRHASRPLPAFDADREHEHERDRDQDGDRDHHRNSDNHHRRHEKALSHRDWSVSLGGGSGEESQARPSLYLMSLQPRVARQISWLPALRPTATQTRPTLSG